MTTLNRRDFLKALGITGGASALSACGLDTNRYKTPVENILPYVVKPDQVTPGTYTFFATTIASGPHARSVTSRHRDGRVTFVSHNRYAPGRASVANTELFELQKHYSPDRLQGPTKGGSDVSWDDGLAELAGAIKAAKGAGKQVAFLGGYRSGAIADLIGDVTDGAAYFWEPLGYGAEAEAAEALFGTRALPFYGFDKAGYVLSFGAPFLSGWGDADTADRYALARDPNVDHSVVRFGLVSGLRDQTGVNADDWYAVAPGSEAQVALAVAKAVAAKTGNSRVAGLVGSPDISGSGLDQAAIDEMAAHFVDLGGLAVPGGASGSADLAAAVYLLNLAANPPAERFHLGGYQGGIATDGDISDLAADLGAGRVGVLILDDANPVYALPAGHPLADALGKADLVVSVSSHPDETQALASLVLPASDAFEDWGIETPRTGVTLFRQPSMTPLYDTRSLGDILLASARAAGLAAAATPTADGDTDAPAAPAGLGFTPATWQEYVKAWALENVLSGDDAWQKAVIEGVVLDDVTPATPSLTGSWSFAAPAAAGELTLVSYAHAHRKDGRYANQPWAQEAPDPVHGFVWDSWLEVSLADAEAMGLAYNDLVTLSTDAGSVDVAVVPTRSVKQGVVALAFGNGHTAAGRYANGYGVNAAKLFQGGFAPVGAKVAKKGGKGDLVTTFSTFGTSDEGRAFGVHVSAEKLAEHGDEAAAHPGELTGIHHLELDHRLRDKGPAYMDFYPEPDHSTYRFALTVDTNACNGCGACSIACYAENNLPIVGKDKVREGREMGWIRINRYWEDDVGGQDAVYFVPMMCQQCGHAGCENVCPVLATYHNIDGLNAMVYNRCVGTRYCSNACPFSARKFNYHSYQWPEPFNLQLNPDVSTRTMGVMEKCTFCVQRLRQTKSAWKDAEGFTAVVPDEVWRDVPACVEACPSQALVFGNLNDEQGHCSSTRKSARTYQPLEELNVLSAVNYLAQASFHDDPTAHHGGGHGDAEHGEEHAEAAHDEHGAAEEAHGDDAHGADAH